MFLTAHEELFLLQVILIGSRLFTIPISKFQSKNWLGLEEQKRNPLKLSTWTWIQQFHQTSQNFGHSPSVKSVFKYSQEITSLLKERKKKRIWYLVVINISKWWLQCTEAHKWRDYWDRWSELHRKGSKFSYCRTHYQCYKQSFETSSSSVEWHRCYYVHFSVFSCVQNNECQQSLGEIWNSWTLDTYTSLPFSRDLRSRKIASAA